MVFYDEVASAAELKKQTIIEFLDRNQRRLEEMRTGISQVIEENRDLIGRLEQVI